MVALLVALPPVVRVPRAEPWAEPALPRWKLRAMEGQPSLQWAQVLADSPRPDDRVHVAVGVRPVVVPGVASCREILGEEWHCGSDCERDRVAHPAPREGRRCLVQVSETVGGRLSHGHHHGCGSEFAGDVLGVGGGTRVPTGARVRCHTANGRECCTGR